MSASTGHEIRALLRAHPAAAPGFRHLTCPLPGPPSAPAARHGPCDGLPGHSPARAAGPARTAPGWALGGPGRRSLARATKGGSTRFTKVAGSYLARLVQCDGSH
ncbi:DUF6274 family protein [Streptomyces sp. NBC_01618]|uniref:DUF6274 family protein n=1 Tax=Streptomyces sp. NBC_01618 TaxID=2975900 RepID=UPI00386FBEDD